VNTKTTVNELVVKVQNGDMEAYEELLRTYLPVIYRTSENIAHLVNDNTRFEEKCLREFDDAIRNFDSAKGDFEHLINRVIYRTKNDFLKNKSGKQKGLLSFEGLTAPKSDGDEGKTIQFRDESVDIEAAYIDSEVAKEIIETRGTNERKRMILEIWAQQGATVKMVDIARYLAHREGAIENSEDFEKTVETLRTYIKRFRAELRKDSFLSGIAGVR